MKSIFSVFISVGKQITGYPVIQMNNVDGIRQLLNHLIYVHGHEKIALKQSLLCGKMVGELVEKLEFGWKSWNSETEQNSPILRFYYH